MRTTVTLEPDVLRLLKEAMRRDGRSFKEVLNAAVRRGLGPGTPRPARPFRVEPHRAALRAGIDPRSLNRLTDELDVEAFPGKTS